MRSKLFDIWLVLILFGHQLGRYTGAMTPDKVIAPLLLAMGLVAVFRSSSARLRRVILLIFLVTALIVIKNISFIGLDAIFWPLMLKDAVKVGYFLVPLLCIDSMDGFRRAGWIVVLIAIIGSVSSFLVSIGLVTLPIERPEEYRIGIELSKAKGLFLASGDLAQYIVFAATWVIVAPRIAIKSGKALRVARWTLFVAIALGLLATQSRNMLLTFLTGLLVLWGLMKVRLLERSNTRTVIMLGIMSTFILTFGTIAVFSMEIVDILSGMGGGSASNTAEGRLQQYAFAWEIIKEHPLFGIDLETYTKTKYSVSGTHNMWLGLLAHGGAVTAIIMLILLLYVFIGVRSAACIPEKSDEAMIVTVYFAALFVAALFHPSMSTMFWALLGIASSLICIEPLARTRVVEQTLASSTQSGQVTTHITTSARRPIGKKVL